MRCYKSNRSWKTVITNGCLYFLLACGIISVCGLFYSLVTEKIAVAKVQAKIVLPSGDIACKRYESDFFKCEDSIVVCYLSGQGKRNMECIKKQEK